MQYYQSTYVQKDNRGRISVKEKPAWSEDQAGFKMQGWWAL